MNSAVVLECLMVLGDKMMWVIESCDDYGMSERLIRGPLLEISRFIADEAKNPMVDQKFAKLRDVIERGPS